MKTMTCRQMGGGCEVQFHAETFEEMAQLSQQHGMEMFQKSDPEHMRIMEEMKSMMQNPQGMVAWVEEKKQLFDALPQDN